MIRSPTKNTKARAPLSPELREKYGTRTVGVRKGDTVRVMRGDYKRIEGKVTRVDPRNGLVFVENITREKTDGTKYFIPIKASKTMVRVLNLDDQWRRRSLEEREGEVHRSSV